MEWKSLYSKKALLKYFLLLVALLVFFQWVDALELLKGIDHLNWIPLFVAVVVYAISQLLRGWRYCTILKEVKEPCHMRNSFIAHLAVPILGKVTPGRLGELVKISMVKSSKQGAVFAYILERVIDLLWLVLFTGYLVAFASEYRTLYVVFIIAFLIGVVCLWHSHWFLQIFSKFLPKDMSKKWFQDHLKHIGWRKNIWILFQGCIIWMVTYYALWLLAPALSVEIPFIVLCAAIAASSIIGIATGIPGGIGAREASLTAILILLGISFDVASLYALFMLVFTLATETLYGLIGFFLHKSLNNP